MSGVVASGGVGWRAGSGGFCSSDHVPHEETDPVFRATRAELHIGEVLEVDATTNNGPHDEVRLHQWHDHDRIEENERRVEPNEPRNHECHELYDGTMSDERRAMSDER